MRDFDFNVAGGGGTFRINSEGKYLRYTSGSAGGGSTRIIVRGLDTGVQIPLSPGQSMRIPASERTWLLTNNNSAAIVGAVIIGDGTVDDATVAGVVEVIDGGRSRTLGAAAFGGYAFQAALAANSALVQLWNPAGSNRRIIVERVSPVTDTNNGAWIATGVAQLSTLVGQGVSKLVGGAASIMQIRRANDPTFPSGVPLDAFVLANSATVIKGYNPISPVVIPPNSGLTAWSTGPAGLGASFEWYEEANV
jgi:hypothetical protein